MNSSPNASDPVARPSLAQLAKGLGHEARMRMLQEMSDGEARTISEMAAVSGRGYDNAIRHLATLRQCGLVVQGRGKLYQIPKQFFPTPGQRVVDYGYCVLRFGAAQ